MQCDCGKSIELNYSRLLSGQKSCGCLRKEFADKFVQNNTTHGKSKTKLYRKYRSILNRCYSPSNKHYDRYGGRGITVCDEWRESFESFSNWAYSNGYDPNKNGHYWSIDRIDNSKGYSPDNCRFTTAEEQMKNRDITTLYEYNGSMYSASEFADKYGITDKSFVYRRAKKGQPLNIILNDWKKAHNIPSGYLDVMEYAQKFNVTGTTVTRWIKKGKVQGMKLGRKWYVKDESERECV